ncbi:MAG: hypothetical protein EPN22_10910 [Nitrospirae bacterium]|nr:MAG: hypothetical protein EPN22_10910 [Nitrospirota bacterium]
MLNNNLSFKNRTDWDKTLLLLEETFKSPETLKLKGIALSLVEAVRLMDGFIQENTAVVCPECVKVCCKNKHSYYDHEDLIFIYSLGKKAPRYEPEIDDDDACRFIAANGCTLERALRPFRCNWYFCGPLIKHMEEGPQKAYRRFIAIFHDTIDLRRRLLGDFFALIK